MILVEGPSSGGLASKIGKLLGVEILRIEHKLFPDGESYIRFPKSVEGEDLVIIQGTYPPQDRNIVQACLIADTARELGAKSISLVVPYLAYARQDKRFLEGEAVSIKTVLRLFQSAGVERVYTVNIHSPWIAEESPIPLINLEAEGALAAHLLEVGLGKALIIWVGK